MVLRKNDRSSSPITASTQAEQDPDALWPRPVRREFALVGDEVPLRQRDLRGDLFLQLARPARPTSRCVGLMETTKRRWVFSRKDAVRSGGLAHVGHQRERDAAAVGGLDRQLRDARRILAPVVGQADGQVDGPLVFAELADRFTA